MAKEVLSLVQILRLKARLLPISCLTLIGKGVLPFLSLPQRYWYRNQWCNLLRNEIDAGRSIEFGTHSTEDNNNYLGEENVVGDEDISGKDEDDRGTVGVEDLGIL
ncbi:unnamed protein product [Fraxinus pennsylvanica]|uniref:Uncharacterized protein n=1 Tax=Fraxinus pennsylvanica TaxID=56036 RepID=A0AAD1ZZD7_9LAMI|nr:unnamed protein product [Fraxinus pennsylvanica]